MLTTGLFFPVTFIARFNPDRVSPVLGFQVAILRPLNSKDLSPLSKAYLFAC